MIASRGSRSLYRIKRKGSPHSLNCGEVKSLEIVTVYNLSMN